jgi:hypothetical protein
MFAVAACPQRDFIAIMQVTTAVTIDMRLLQNIAVHIGSKASKKREYSV